MEQRHVPCAVRLIVADWWDSDEVCIVATSLYTQRATVEYVASSNHHTPV
jgi:hypothetical protein